MQLLIDHLPWKYCWLICCEKKILFVGWKSTAYKPSEHGDWLQADPGLAREWWFFHDVCALSNPCCIMEWHCVYGLHEGHLHRMVYKGTGTLALRLWMLVMLKICKRIGHHVNVVVVFMDETTIEINLYNRQSTIGLYCFKIIDEILASLIFFRGCIKPKLL